MPATNRTGYSGPVRAIFVPVAGASAFLAVTTSSQQFGQIAGADMGVSETYLLTCSVDAYVRQGADPTASAADGSMLVPARVPALIDGAQGAKLAVLGTAAGVATLQRMAILV